MFRIAVALLIVVFNLSAQTSTGTVQGMVTDQSGSPVAGARLKLTEQSTSLSREQFTGAEGNFEFHSLPRGAYQLEAEHPGFKKELVSGISLQVAQTQRIDVKLEVGAVTESVEVRGAADLLQASSPPDAPAPRSVKATTVRRFRWVASGTILPSCSSMGLRSPVRRSIIIRWRSRRSSR